MWLISAPEERELFVRIQYDDGQKLELAEYRDGAGTPGMRVLQSISVGE